MQHILFAVTAAIGIFFGDAAFDVPVQWTFSGATFIGGGAATGSFTYNADTDTYSNVAVTTTSGSISGSTYSFASAKGAGIVVFAIKASGYTGFPGFVVAFSPSLTNAGGRYR